MMLRIAKNCLILASFFALTGCLGMPKDVSPVADFQVERYLGTWYEIARLDHSFERGLEQVTAEYSLRDNGGLNVINRGFDTDKNEWKQATGKAYFVQEPTTGYLKVSFFGPFYGSYVIFDLDEQDYQYAFVSGNNTSYLWLLSRTPTLPDEVIDRFTAMAEARGFNTNDLIFVNQEDSNHPH